MERIRFHDAPQVKLNLHTHLNYTLFVSLLKSLLLFSLTVKFRCFPRNRDKHLKHLTLPIATINAVMRQIQEEEKNEL